MTFQKPTKQKFTPLKILNSKEKREIEKKLNEQFGVDFIPGILIQKGRERLFFFSGSFSQEEIKKLEDIIIIERVGIYFAKFIEDNIKLSIEGTQILKDQIKKNIFEISDKHLEEWIKGQDLQIKTEKYRFLAIKHKNDFLGCGKASENKIGNFIPKNRRLKERG